MECNSAFPGKKILIAFFVWFHFRALPHSPVFILIWLLFSLEKCVHLRFLKCTMRVLIELAAVHTCTKMKYAAKKEYINESVWMWRRTKAYRKKKMMKKEEQKEKILSVQLWHRTRTVCLSK